MIKELKNKRASFAITDAMLKSVRLLNLDLAGICRKALEIEIEKELLQKQDKAIKKENSPNEGGA